MHAPCGMKPAGGAGGMLGAAQALLKASSCKQASMAQPLLSWDFTISITLLWSTCMHPQRVPLSASAGSSVLPFFRTLLRGSQQQAPGSQAIHILC